eukprot:TRINITY_DN13406_c0_g1_i2.p1 TRINITY_DN13406_c0_g1~~TRINITY_DN13406_c0_g1_i2.p1  ORF type:complete len:101 (+),score=12.80 TRINITY_DN13406_c0_g1_i2:142-444(+)
MDGQLMLIDSYQPGKIVQTYTGHQNTSGLPIEASFSPDAQFVLSGSDDGGVYAWDTLQAGAPTKLMAHSSPVMCVRWNPQKMMLASACCSLAFWLPSKSK